MSGVVFKLLPESKAVNVPAANQKYVYYCATRKGCFYNEGCGFGLWGRMPGMHCPQPLNNLDTVVKAMGQLARGDQDHPPKRLYRTIVSVDEQTARTLHLYDRSRWESLINENVQAIGEKFGIRPGELCYVASMHYKKTHPHVHLSFFDNSDSPHASFIPKNRFERMTEEIRATLNGALYRTELQQLQSGQSALEQDARSDLELLLAEYPLPAMLELDRIKDRSLDELARGLVELAAHVPAHGSLDYGFLPPAYKERLDTWVDTVLRLPQFSALNAQYEEITGQISQRYGNGARMAAENLEKARKELHKALGNEVMKCIATAVKSLTPEPPEDIKRLRAILGSAIVQLLRADPSYRALVQAMPSRATPWRVLRQDAAFQTLERRLLQHVVSDVRIRKRIARYVEENRDPELKKAIQLQLGRLRGKDPNARADARKQLKALRGEDAISKEAFKALHQTVGQIIYDEARIDKGYPVQERCGVTMKALIQLFAAGRGAQARQQARRDQLKAHDKQLSKAAKKDRRHKRSQAGDWEQE